MTYKLLVMLLLPGWLNPTTRRHTSTVTGTSFSVLHSAAKSHSCICTTLEYQSSRGILLPTLLIPV